jgi:pimeloyl-ACP methyl ester carboxylesterase
MSYRIPRAQPAGPWPIPSLGERAELIPFESDVLRGNPLGDPSRRNVAVLRPPSGKTEGAPLILYLPGFAGSGPAELTRANAFEESLFQVFDRLQRTHACGEATVIAPDPTTALAGNQYVNSSAVGRYDDHIVDELLPWAQDRFHAGPVGVLGQSSGGFGALHLALEHPGRFAAVGSSAGDMAFDYCHVPEFPLACREMQKHGGPEEFLAALARDPTTIRGPHDASGAALIEIAAAASYSPDDAHPGQFDLPFDWRTSEIDPAVWRRWTAFDPVVRVATEEGADALGSLRRLHLTASRGDEWGLDQGARWFVAAARRHQVPVVHQEFDGGHFVRNPRFVSLFTGMVRALRGEESPE